MGLVLTATAAAAVLYGTVVFFALGPPSPLALREADVGPPPRVVRVHLRALGHPAATRPVTRLPQASPGRAQPVQSHAALPVVTSQVSRRRAAAKPQTTGQVAQSRSAAAVDPETPSAASPEALSQAETSVVAVPSLPVLELPETPALPASLP